MKKNVCYGVLFVLFLLVIGLGLYFWNNYNQFTIYTFEGSDENFFVSGNATFSKKLHLLNLNHVESLGPDMQMKTIRISLFAKIKGKERLIYADGREFGAPVSLTNYLSTYSRVLSEQYGYGEYFNQTIIKKFPSVVFFRIEGIDSKNQPFETTLSLTCNTYANNQWFYRKTNSI